MVTFTNEIAFSPPYLFRSDGNLVGLLLCLLLNELHHLLHLPRDVGSLHLVCCSHAQDEREERQKNEKTAARLRLGDGFLGENNVELVLVFHERREDQQRAQ